MTNKILEDIIKAWNNPNSQNQFPKKDIKNFLIKATTEKVYYGEWLLGMFKAVNEKIFSPKEFDQMHKSYLTERCKLKLKNLDDLNLRKTISRQYPEYERVYSGEIGMQQLSSRNGYLVSFSDENDPFAIPEHVVGYLRSLVKNKESDIEKAKAIFDWMQKDIECGNLDGRYKSANDVLKSGSGVCGERAFLYVTAARSVGLKSGFVVVNETEDGRNNHACASVDINGKIILVDPAYHKFDVHHRKYEIKNDSVIRETFANLNNISYDDFIKKNRGRDYFTLTEEEESKALDLLKKPSYLYDVKSLLDMVIAGEDHSKLLLYVIALGSRFASPDCLPQHVVFMAAAGSGKTHVQDNVLKLLPKRNVMNVKSFTDKSLKYFEENLWGKVINLEEFNPKLNNGAIEIMRQILSGSENPHIVTVFENGERVAREIGPEGIPVFITGTTKDVDYEWLTRCVALHTDESPEQTKRVLDFQARKKAMPDMSKEKFIKLSKPFVDAYQVLKQRSVVNPFAYALSSFLSGSGSLVKRRNNQKLLDLVSKVACIHQYQREHIKYEDEYYVPATLGDLYISLQLVKPFLEKSLLYLNNQTMRLFRQILKNESSSLEDLANNKEIMRELGNLELKMVVNELEQNELVVCNNGLVSPNSTLLDRYNFDSIEFDITSVKEAIRNLCYWDKEAIEKLNLTSLDDDILLGSYKEILVDPLNGRNLEIRIKTHGNYGKLEVHNG